jgi:threonyl-tRNA synthetase
LSEWEELEESGAALFSLDLAEERKHRHKINKKEIFVLSPLERPGSRQWTFPYVFSNVQRSVFICVSC